MINSYEVRNMLPSGLGPGCYTSYRLFLEGDLLDEYEILRLPCLRMKWMDSDLRVDFRCPPIYGIPEEEQSKGAYPHGELKLIAKWEILSEVASKPHYWIQNDGRKETVFKQLTKGSSEWQELSNDFARESSTLERFNYMCVYDVVSVKQLMSNNN